MKQCALVARRSLSVVVVIVSSVFISACATAPSSSLAQDDGRITLGSSYIGESYDAVITRATSAYKIEPQCETRKISLKRQRRAFIYDICGYNPDAQRFANAPLAEVVYHFIERKLVRVDVMAQGDEVLLEEVKDDIQAVFSDAQAAPVEGKPDSLEWVANAHIAGLRAGKGGSAGNVHVRLLDESLRIDAPWLTHE